MKKPLIFIIPLLIVLGCYHNSSKEMHTLLCEESLKKGYIKENIVDFFNTIYEDYKCQIEKKYNMNNILLDSRDDIQKNSDLNKETLYKLYFLHKLFTTNSPTDCSSSGILQIPYFWKKSRGKIHCKGSAKISPRTPTGFLKDLVSDYPKYSHNNCGEFYTFGWCGTREMSFAALLKNMGFKTKIVAEGIHCWTEVLVPLHSDSDIKRNYILKIDNTYETFDIKEQVDIENVSFWEKNTNYHDENNQCEKYDKDCSLCLMDKHYNPRANDTIDNIIVSHISAQRIKKQIEKYLK